MYRNLRFHCKRFKSVRNNMTHDCSCYTHFRYFDSYAINLNKALFVTREITASAAVIFASSLVIISNIRLSSVCLMIINIFDRKLTFSFLNTSYGFLLVVFCCPSSLYIWQFSTIFHSLCYLRDCPVGHM